MATSGAPLIVSSNRFNDIAPFTKRLYASDPKKWGSILPWEFPQNASKKAEEDFLILTFSAKTIQEAEQLLGSARKEKFRFLKQAWYSLALWNLNFRVHGAAQQWLQENEGLWKDSEMVGSICGSETTLNAFFSADQKADYGEKLLMWVMRSVQYEVRQWHGLPQPAQPKMEEKPETARHMAQEAVQVNDNIKMPRPGSAGNVESEPKSRPIPMSAQPAKAQLANPASLIKDSSQTPTFSLPSTAPSYMSRMTDFTVPANQHSATSVQPKHENANQVPPSRQRGNSHSKRSFSQRWNGRGQPQLQPPFQTPSFPPQSGPSFQAPPSGANNMAMQVHSQTIRPHAPEGPPGVSFNPMAIEHAAQNIHVQRYPGPPMSNFNNNAFQQPNPYYQSGQAQPPHSVFAPHNAPQLNSYYHTPALLDRTNIDDRYDRRMFSGASESSVNMSYPSTGAPAMYQDQHGGGNDGRGGHRRQSMSSRGGNGKIRGGYKNGRGGSSRGSNSFSAESGRGGKEMFTRHGTFTHEDKPKQHREFEMPHPPASAFAKNRNRNGSITSSNWRRGDQKQMPLAGNDAVKPQQAFNGINQHLPPLSASAFQGSAPPPMRVMSSEQYGHAPPRNQEDWNRRHYAEKRALSGPGPQYQPHGYTNVFPPIGSGWEGRALHTTPMRNHGAPAPRTVLTQEDRIALQPVKGVIHDEGIAERLRDKSKVLIRNHIGDEFTYVNKLILFGIETSVEDHEIQNLFTSVTGIKHSAASEFDSERRIKTENPHIAARITSKTYNTSSRPQHSCVYVIFETSAQAREALKLSGSMSFGNYTVKIEVPKEYWDVTHMNYPGLGATGPRGWHRTFAGSREGYGAPPHAHKTSASSSLGELNAGSQSIHANDNKNSIASGLDAAKTKSEDTTPTPSGASTPRAGKKKKNKNKKAVTAAASGGDLRVEALQSSFSGHAESATRISSPVFRSESTDMDCANAGVDGRAADEAMSDKSNVTIVRDPATTSDISLSEALEPASVDDKVSTASRDDSQTKSEPAFSPEVAKDGGFPRVVMPTIQQPADGVGELDESVKNVAEQSFRGPTKATQKAEGATNDKVNRQASITTNAEQDDTPSKTAGQDDENVDDSFHTATGSPHGSDNEQKQTQGNACDSKPSGDMTTRVDATASATSSPISARIQSPKDVQSPKDAQTDMMAKTPKKAPVPQLPRVRVSEPTTLQLKSNDDKQETNDQRTASGSTVPPLTPAFQTAPTTPAYVSDALGAEEQDEPSTAESADHGADVAASVDHLDDRAKSEQKVKKPEKPKGPSQTPSLSVFAKPQRTQGKSKKPNKKVRKGTSADLRSFSDTTGETPSRVVSGAVASDSEAPETSVVPTICDFSASAEVNDKEVTTPTEDILTSEVGLARGSEQSGDKSEEKADNEVDKAAGEVDLAEAMETASSSTSPSRPLNERRGIVEIFNRLIPGSKQPAQASLSAPQEDEAVDKIQDAGKFTAPKGSSPVTSSKFPAPIAQMQTNDKETFKTDHNSRPFSQALGTHGADGPRDSGHSGGSMDQQSTCAIGAPAGLGISTDMHIAGDQGAMGNTGKVKKKKKKAGGKRKRAAREALAESEAGLLTELKEGSLEFVDDSTSSTKGEAGDKEPFQFLFQANNHPYPSQSLAETHSQSPSQASNLSGSGSEMSSHTLRRSSQEETLSPPGSLSNDSPTRTKKIMEAQKAQGKNNLITAPPLRHKHKRISSRSSRKKSASGTSPTTSDKSRTIYLHRSFSHESDSDDEDSGPKQFDKLIDAQKRHSRRSSMLYWYLGPGKRSEDRGQGEEVEDSRKPETPLKVLKAKTKRITGDEHDEDLPG